MEVGAERSIKAVNKRFRRQFEEECKAKRNHFKVKRSKSFVTKSLFPD